MASQKASSRLAYSFMMDRSSAVPLASKNASASKLAAATPRRAHVPAPSVCMASASTKPNSSHANHRPLPKEVRPNGVSADTAWLAWVAANAPRPTTSAVAVATVSQRLTRLAGMHESNTKPVSRAASAQAGP